MGFLRRHFLDPLRGRRGMQVLYVGNGILWTFVGVLNIGHDHLSDRVFGWVITVFGVLNLSLGVTALFLWRKPPKA